MLINGLIRDGYGVLSVDVGVVIVDATPRRGGWVDGWCGEVRSECERAVRVVSECE